jgi:DNA modification methylase
MRNTILQGDIREVVKTIRDNSVNCIVTSPPYWKQRDYGSGMWEGGAGDCDHSPKRKNGRESSTITGGQSTNGHAQEAYTHTCGKCGAVRIDNQIGLEATPAEYVQTLASIFRELRRVLHPSGTVWLNLGDKSIAKNSLGLPWRVALALQDDGWTLRQDIIWFKDNPMPESVTDRPTTAHEYLFLLTKKPRYWYDAEAIAEPSTESTAQRAKYGWNGTMIFNDGKELRNQPDPVDKMGDRWCGPTRNKRSVWQISTQPYSGFHFATFPPDLVEPCIRAGCPAQVCAECGKPWVRVVEKIGKSLPVEERHGRVGHNGQPPQISGNYWDGPTTQATNIFRPTCSCNAATRPGVVLDPFFGSGTVGQVAIENGRDWLGVELNPDYIKLAEKRIAGAQPVLFVPEVYQAVAKPEQAAIW